MYKLYARLAIVILSIVLFGYTQTVNAGLTKGIYLTQSTLENTEKLNHLIKNANRTGINTFIVDFDGMSRQYRENIQLLKENNITYIARIVIFPGGGTPEQVNSLAYREKKFKLVKEAIGIGASQIQLDYIRYTAKQPGSHENAIVIAKLVQWFKDRLAIESIPLQVDVFGITSFGESKHIGQSIPLIAQSADVICPMVYPSHYDPYLEHAKQPYQTVYKSLTSIKKQFPGGSIPFKLVPYIELSNYRYPMSTAQRLPYIHAQIKAAEDAGADGWYAWSPHNYYDNLFRVLETYPVK